MRALLILNQRNLFFILSFFWCFHHALSKRPRFIVDVETVDNCPGVKQADTIAVVLKKLNRTVQILNFDIAISDGFNNKQHLAIDIQKWNNGWKGLLNFNFGKACSNMFRVLGEVLNSMVKAGILQPGLCPIPKGNYSLRNVHIDFGKVPLVIYEGRYKFRLSVLNQENDVALCTESIVNIKS